MKNYEKYADEIRKYKVNKDKYFCNEFITPHILKKDSCASIGCGHCHMLQMIWLLEDYEEPETDWNKVEVDTPILVKQGENGTWIERHFAEYKNGIIYTWKDGHTSWTEDSMTGWKYAKLAESEEE